MKVHIRQKLMSMHVLLIMYISGNYQEYNPSGSRGYMNKFKNKINLKSKTNLNIKKRIEIIIIIKK